MEFHAIEKFLKVETFLPGSYNGSITEIEKGLHTYNYDCELPETLPYSVKGKHGKISFTVAANLDIPMAFDLKDEQSFVVVRNEDLNLFPELKLPREAEKIKTFCCLFCASNKLTLKVHLQKTGFALGEKIVVKVELENRSSRNVKWTIIKLQRIDKFSSHSPIEKTITKEKKIVTKKIDGAKAGETKLIEAEIEVPTDLMLSNEKQCDIFKITYELQITAKTSGLSFSPVVKVPVTIGSVAIYGDCYQAVAPYK